MANDLVRLNPHIDQMRERLSQTAETERSLVQSLSDALNRMDQETLRSVRNMSADHEARRAGIFNELQTLSASIGTFQQAREPGEPVAISPADFFEQNPDRDNRDVVAENGHQHAPVGGDWRQATKTLSYRDELDFLIRNGHLLVGKSSPH